MKRLFGIALAGSLSAVLMMAAQVSGLAVPNAPSLDRPIIDQTATLSQQQIDQLAAQINTSRQAKSYQIGILMIPNLEGAALEDYSLLVARAWGIGEKSTNNGALLLIVKDERKLRIEVGSGLEGDLTDARASRIIRNSITPKFRENQYFEGITAAVTEIQNAIEKKPESAALQASSSTNQLKAGANTMEWLFLGFWAVPWVGAVLARSKSWWAGGLIGGVIGLGMCLIFGFALWYVIGAVIVTLIGFGLDFVVSKNYKKSVSHGETPSWWAGGGFGGSSGGLGGGGGFGGGGFSGGGSSGNW